MPPLHTRGNVSLEGGIRLQRREFVWEVRVWPSYQKGSRHGTSDRCNSINWYLLSVSPPHLRISGKKLALIWCSSASNKLLAIRYLFSRYQASASVWTVSYRQQYCSPVSLWTDTYNSGQVPQDMYAYPSLSRAGRTGKGILEGGFLQDSLSLWLWYASEQSCQNWQFHHGDAGSFSSHFPCTWSSSTSVRWAVCRKGRKSCTSRQEGGKGWQSWILMILMQPIVPRTTRRCKVIWPISQRL